MNIMQPRKAKPLHAIVKNGRLVLDEPTDLPEGLEVSLVVVEDEFEPGEKARLLAAIEESAEAIERAPSGDPRFAVDAHACESVAKSPFKQFLIVPLATPYYRRQNCYASPVAGFQDGVDDLIDGLLDDWRVTIDAVLNADARKEQAKEVVDLGHRANGRTGIVRHRLLFDGNCRREPFDEIDVRAFHQSEKLACIRRKTFNVPTLSLGINRVKGESRLA